MILDDGGDGSGSLWLTLTFIEDQLKIYDNQKYLKTKFMKNYSADKLVIAEFSAMNLFEISQLTNKEPLRKVINHKILLWEFENVYICRQRVVHNLFTSTHIIH